MTNASTGSPQAKLNQLEMLVAVADAGSFGAAAAALGCTQSRISHAIAQLEHSLGASLLTRSRSGCVPTDAGHRVLAQARQILRLTLGLGQVARNSEGVGGHVRIACFRSVAAHLLPHALEALALEYPAIRIDIDDGCEERDDVTQALTEGRAEIGIAQLPLAAHLDMVVRSFVSDAYALVLPAALALRAPLTWDQLNGLPYIQLSCAGAFEILDRCRAAGFNAELARTLSTDSGILAMVRRGLGYSILPRLATFPEPNGVRAVDLPIPATRQFALVALPATARLPAPRIVLRFLRQQRLVAQGEAFRAGIVHW